MELSHNKVSNNKSKQKLKELLEAIGSARESSLTLSNSTATLASSTTPARVTDEKLLNVKRLYTATGQQIG